MSRKPGVSISGISPAPSQSELGWGSQHSHRRSLGWWRCRPDQGIRHRIGRLRARPDTGHKHTGGKRADEHHRSGRRRTDQARGRDRRSRHRDAGDDRHPRRIERESGQRARTDGVGFAVRERPRPARQRGLEPPGLGEAGAALRQGPSQYRPLRDVSGGGRRSRVEAALADAQTAAREMVLAIAHRTAEGLRTLGFPLR